MRGFDTPVDASRIARQAKRAGYDYVARYYSFNPRKNLTPSEARALADAGLAILSIWEAAGDKYASFTAANGRREAAEALRLAQEVGQPAGSAIYFAVDFDATEEQVREGVRAYFEAVGETVGLAYKVGCYGSGAVLRELGDLIQYKMLACAPGWRGTRGFRGADVKQSMPTALFGVPADGVVRRVEVGSLDDIGAWQLEALEDQRPLLRRGDYRPAVGRLQSLLTDAGYPLVEDERFGPKTDRAVRRFQRDHGLPVNGFVGPDTWAMLLAEA